MNVTWHSRAPTKIHQNEQYSKYFNKTSFRTLNVVIVRQKLTQNDNAMTEYTQFNQNWYRSYFRHSFSIHFGKETKNQELGYIFHNCWKRTKLSATQAYKPETTYRACYAWLIIDCLISQYPLKYRS
jgi:hypothetical protein